MDTTTLGELVALQRGHDLTETQRRPGNVPVVGSAGIHGFHDTAKAKGPGGAAPSSSLVDPPGGVTPTQCGFNNSTNAPGCPTAAYQAHVLQDDGAHITTPMQGLVANAVLGALRSRGFSLNSLTDAEILAIAGVAPQPPSSSLALRWGSLASKCKRSTSICRIKGKLLAQNAGVSTSEAMSVSFLLSSDTAADAGDLLLGSGAIRALPAGKRAKVKLRATLPIGVTPDGHYLIAQPTRGGPFIQGPLD